MWGRSVMSAGHNDTGGKMSRKDRSSAPSTAAEHNNTDEVAAEAAPPAADLSEWIIPGTLGALSALRQGDGMEVSAELTDLAMGSAENICMDPTDPDTHATGVLEPGQDVGLDLRYLVTTTLPPPDEVAVRLRPVWPYPLILLSPSQIHIGACYRYSPTGHHVIVVACRRRVIARPGRKPKGE